MISYDIIRVYVYINNNVKDNKNVKLLTRNKKYWYIIGDNNNQWNRILC